MVLCGSPRKKGNTNRLTKWFINSAAEAGATVETIDTTRLKYKHPGCIACMGCQKSDKYECVIKDEAQPILARIPEMDVLVITTPVYWFASTAQLKVFVDRTFSLLKMDPETMDYIHPLAGKMLALIATGGGDYEGGLNCVDLTFKSGASFLDMDYQSILVPNAPIIPAEIERDLELKERIEAFGKTMAS